MTTITDPLAREIAEQYDRFQSSLEGLDRERKYLNYGYTTDDNQSYEDRQEALCLQVFDAAEVSANHRLLDVGFGSGEQDFLWARRFEFERLVGYNISSAQVDYANRRAQAQGQASRLQFVHGRAEELPGVEPASVDRLLAVECAFYFDRAAFYRRAAETLVPGGRLVAADISFATVATPLTWLRSDMNRVGTLSRNRKLWSPYFETKRLTPIHRQAIPGVDQTVLKIKEAIGTAGFTKEQRKEWQSMAFWSRLVALGLRTRLLRYDLIVLERR